MTIDVVADSRFALYCRGKHPRLGLIRHRDHVGGSRHYLHDMEAFVLELLEESRERGDGRRMDVVQEQNAFAVRFEPLHSQGYDLFSTDAVMPIVGHGVGRKNDQPARGEFALEDVGSRQTWNAE